MNLFKENYEAVKPLALKMRPESLDDFVGQEKLLGKNGMLRKVINSGNISNLILYGPPGTGKSTIVEIISKTLDYNFEIYNATTTGLNDLKPVIEKAKKSLEYYKKKTILFLDEIHRFNKLQQDFLLSHTESGIITFIGATTENPYYTLNNALLSRVMVFEFKALSKMDIKKIVNNACKHLNIEINETIKDIILDISNGDARIALNYVELYSKIHENLSEEEILENFVNRSNSFDKTQDKYDIISALIKSMRGSDPDSAIYWLARLLHGGEDPRYIARRLVILASEDIGMANPEAMLIANAAFSASERIGMPEIRIILGQAVIYLAISTKSNSSYTAINEALSDVEKGPLDEVPKTIAHDNINYKYPHDYSDNFVYQKYRLKNKKYYLPGNNKNETLIKNKLEKFWKKDRGE